MTQLLVSVRSVAEARIALEHGADIIDVKEPSRGPLGAADRKTVRRIVEFVDGRVPVSAACGELRQRKPFPIVRGLDWFKIGLSGTIGSRWHRTWRKAFCGVRAGACPVAVAYADWKACSAPQPFRVAHVAANAGCRVVLLDTYLKKQGSLLDLCSMSDLARFVRKIRSNHAQVALAGSLTIRALAQIMPLEPDIIAVRGAVCRGGREGTIDGELVEEWAGLVRGRIGAW